MGFFLKNNLDQFAISVSNKIQHYCFFNLIKASQKVIKSIGLRFWFIGAK